MDITETVRPMLCAYAADDVRALLHVDHQAILDLARRLADASRAPGRKALVRELKPLLVAHSRAEEASVYRPLMNLRNSPASRMAGNECMVEHNLTDIVLERLTNTADARSDMWRAHAKVLRESLQHHIIEEESEVFTHLAEHFSDADRVHMGADFVARRSALLSQKTRRSVASPMAAHKTRMGQIA
jgi:hemerythrin-like domain-containing protein